MAKTPTADPAEQRAAARRAEEDKARQAQAEAAADEQIKTIKAAEAAARLAAELQPRLAALRTEVRKITAREREQVAKVVAATKLREAAIGDLEGANLTAGETARLDPARAFAGLERALAAFRDKSK